MKQFLSAVTILEELVHVLNEKHKIEELEITQ